MSEWVAASGLTPRKDLPWSLLAVSTLAGLPWYKNKHSNLDYLLVISFTSLSPLPASCHCVHSTSQDGNVLCLTFTGEETGVQRVE